MCKTNVIKLILLTSEGLIKFSLSQQGLKTTSYLLEKLLANYNLNTLILNLYPGNKGYSLSLKVNGNTQNLHAEVNVSNIACNVQFVLLAII